MYIPALTINQPWAWAMTALDSTKRFENRNRATSYRGPVYVHAGRSLNWVTDDACEALREHWPSFKLDRPGVLRMIRDGRLATGAIVGCFTIVDCVRVDAVEGQPFAWGPWCYVVTNPKPLAQPYTIKGQLGLWDPGTLPDYVRALVA